MASSTPFDGTNFLTSAPDEDQPHGNDYLEHQSTRKSMQFINNKEHEAIATDPSAASGGGVHKNGSGVAYFGSTAPALRPDGLTALADNDVDKGRTWYDSSDNVIRTKTWNGSSWVLASNDLPGSITEYAGSSAPTGWLLCDGSTGLSTVANPEYVQLFSIIGTTYGGTSTTDFALPDKRGRVGIGTGTGDAADATTHTLGTKEGAETHTLTTGELADHGHPFRTSATSAGAGDTSGGLMMDDDGTQVNQSAYTGSLSNTPGQQIGGTGEDTPHNNLQPLLVLNYIIKI